MTYRVFGNTGIEISALGFGCMRFPVINGDVTRIDENRAMEMVHHAIDQGINYFDTAYPYHAESFTQGGASEPFLAKALKEGRREKVYIATKLPSWLTGSREDLDRYLDEQLRRLNTDHIDFYLLHSLNQPNWKKLSGYDVLEFLDRAIASGKIRYAGFSFHDEIDLFKEIVDAYDWTFTQIMYNYHDEHFQAGKEGLEYAAQKGLAVVAMEPLRGGSLVTGLPAEARRILNNSAPGRTEVEWALRWIWKHPQVSVVLSGMSHLDHVKENILLAKKVSNVEWTAGDEEAVTGAKAVIMALQRVDCTTCGYCMPCPHGVDIPRNFSLCNDHHMLSDPGAKVRYHRLLGEEQRASACIRCGECVEKCPQQIPIPDELEYVADLFAR